MSDFKFSCPKCGQNIVCDTSNAGMVLACPACQNSLTVPPPPPAVPATPGKLGINKTAHVHQAAPPPPPGGAPAKPAWGAKAEPPPPKKTSILAIAALVCSLLGIALAGIICGHLALARIARDSALKGAGLAKAGLIIGYLSIALVLGMVFVGVPYLKKQAEIKQQAEAEVARQLAEQAAQAAKAAKAAEAKKAGWKMDLSDVDIPDRPASGKIHAVNFTVDLALLQAGALVLEQTNGTSRVVQITSLLKAGETITNHTINISSTDTNRVPKITLGWRDVGSTKSGSQVFTNGYAMKLQFGALADMKLPGKIYLSLPDPEQSYVGGNFEITFPVPVAPAPGGARGAPGAGRQPGGPGQPGGGGGGGRRGRG